MSSEKNPILLIINYLFKKNNQKNTDDTIESFFNNGTSFPKFLELIFKEKIPGIIENPSDLFQKELNNDKSIEFLFIKNTEIKELYQEKNNQRDNELLLTLILTKQCFKIDYTEIIAKCNSIVEPLNIIFKNPEKLIAIESILYLLNVITNGKVPINIETSNFDENVKNVFKIAKIPQVINKKSFEQQYKFTFIIQILIILDESEYDQDIYLLKLINSILKYYHSKSYLYSDNKNIQFQSIAQAIEINNIIKFSKIFFAEDDLIFLENLENQDCSYNEKIQNFVQILIKNKPVLKNINFNFKDKKDQKTTALLLYRKIISLFFIKYSKQELLDKIQGLFVSIQCDNVLFQLLSDISNNFAPEDSLFYDWDVYLALFYFTVHKNNNFQIKDKEEIEHDLLNQTQIPLIIDKNYLKLKEESILIYCQIQFFFDKINIFLVILGAYKLFKQLRLPDFKLFLANIKRIENIKIKIIKNEFKKNELEENDLKENDLEENDLKENDLKENELEKHRFKNPKLIKALKIKQTNLIKKEKKSSLKMMPKAEYWNQYDDNFSFKDGILFQSTNKQFNVYNKVINEYNKLIEKPKKKISKSLNSTVFFNDIPPQSVKSNLYKFFYYDEKKEKWEKNSSSINQFLKEMFIEHCDVNTTLVLLFNSDEKELIELSSKLIQFLYPDFDDKDDDQIYVYALYGKSLSLLNYNVNLEQQDSSKRPIFLLLHVPENKMKMKNIKTIVYQIYFFLTIISDIEIVILNKEYYADQLQLIENMNNFQNSYKASIDFHINLKNQQSKETKQQPDETDNEEESESEDENENEDEEFDSISILPQKNFHHLKSQKKFIILFNSKLINRDCQIEAQNDFFESITQRIGIGNCHVHFINISKPVTYRNFLTTFNEITMKHQNNYKETFESFDLLEIMQISEFYMKIRNNVDRKSILREMIQKRFDQLKDFNDNQINELEILAALYKEINSTYPLIDDDYANDINTILLSIKKNIVQQNINVLNTELEEASNENILHLKDVIYSQDYLSEIYKGNLKISHENYLKNQFFNIISLLFSEKERLNIFEFCYSILENQINEDLRIIDKIFEFFENDQKSTNKQRVFDFNEQRKRGTNYVVTERENVREIDIIVDTGHLENAIKTDF